jgi:hypothetical protein
MQDDTQPFPVNTIDLNNKKVLVRPEVADKDKGKGIIIGDPHILDENRKNLSREVVAEKTLDGGDTLKITIKSSTLGGKHRQTARLSPLFSHHGRFGSLSDNPSNMGGWSDIV